MTVKQSKLDRGFGRFHQKCYWQQKRSRVEVPCERCERPVLRKPSEIKRGYRFCTDCRLDRRQRSDEQIVSDAWARVDRAGHHWTFNGAHNNMGYPQVHFHGHHRLMTHVAWFLATGHWPTRGEYVCHTEDCGSDGCVRNDDAGTYTVDGVEHERHGHLFLADHYVTMADARSKGRMPQLKLTRELALTIVSAAQRGVSVAELAALTNVTQPTIRNVLSGRAWRSVTGITAVDRRRTISTADEQAARRMYADGMKIAAITRELGNVNYFALYSLLTRQPRTSAPAPQPTH